MTPNQILSLLREASAQGADQCDVVKEHAALEAVSAIFGFECADSFLTWAGRCPARSREEVLAEREWLDALVQGIETTAAQALDLAAHEQDLKARLLAHEALRQQRRESEFPESANWFMDRFGREDPLNLARFKTSEPELKKTGAN